MKASLKLIVAACALALGASPFLQAQDAPPPAPKQEGPPAGGGQRGGGRMASPEARLAAMKEALALTDDQSAKIKVLLEDEAKQLAALTQETRREQGQKIRAETNTKITALLTEEQKTKFAAMRPAGRGQGGGGGGGKKAADGEKAAPPAKE